ncbi:MAG TPA: hypothetical protein VF148_13590 [Acidimicrobiia bacterium]
MATVQGLEAETHMERVNRLGPYIAAAAVAVLAALVSMGLQLTNPRFDSELTTAVDWAKEISLTLFIGATIVAMLGLVSYRVVPRVGGSAFLVGQSLILVGLLAGLLLGHAPDWFFVVGGPGNLLAFIGMMVVAVYAWRHRTLPRVIAVLMPLSVLFGVGVAEFGGGIVTAVVCAGVGIRLSAYSKSVKPVVT